MIRYLMKTALTIIKHDRLILAPSIMYFIILQMVQVGLFTPSQGTPNIPTSIFSLTIIWICECLIRIIVITMGLSAIHTDKPEMDYSIKNSMKHAPKILVASFLFSLPSLLLFPKLIALVVTPEPSGSALLYVLAFGGLILRIIGDIIPIPMLTHSFGMSLGIKTTLLFFKSHFLQTMFVLALIMALSYSAIIVELLLAAIPVLGDAVLAPIYQGWIHVLGILIMVVFYLSTLTPTKKSNVDLLLNDALDDPLNDSSQP